MEHNFGGSWTDEKLLCIKKYLDAYRVIFTRNEAAKHYITYYIDAFAGTGYRTKNNERHNLQLLINDEDNVDADTISYINGSARIALELDSPFDRYIFIEKNQSYANELKKLQKEFSAINVQIRRGDANKEIPEICKEIDWKKSRAVMFLDPYGMSIDWSVLEKIASTKAIDMWLLFPLGALNRMLTNERHPPEIWRKTISKIFGNDEWVTNFYNKSPQTSFLDDMEVECKKVNFTQLGKYINDRLSTIFAGVAQDPLQLCNSRNSPIYLLCFAVGNPNKVSIALSIANSILKNSRIK